MALLVVMVVTEEGERLDVGLMLEVEATMDAEGGLLLEFDVLVVAPGTESSGLVDAALIARGLLLLVTGEL